MDETWERRIYVDFYTNLAVAWFAAGILAPFFANQLALAPSLLKGLLGVFGAAGSLFAARWAAYI